MRVTINALTTNSARQENVDGREFTVLKTMMIRSDTSMNGIYYPHDELKASFSQLEDVPAPIGHPKVMGQHVSASNNFSRGNHDVGAFVRNVTMIGKEVFGEIWIDNELAGRSEKGRTLLQRIANKAKIGVSTGLTIAKVIAKTGVDELGKAFNSVGRMFSFDHVALLDAGEEAAGSHANTEIVYNNQGESLFVINHEDGGQPDSKPKESKMDITIDAGDLSKPDRVKLQSLTASELMLAVNAEKPKITVADAQELLESKGMKVNSADALVVNAEEYAIVKANAELYVESENERVDEIKTAILTNSKMTDEDLKGMDEMKLTRLANSLTPSNDFSMNAAITTNASANTETKLMDGM